MWYIIYGPLERGKEHCQAIIYPYPYAMFVLKIHLFLFHVYECLHECMYVCHMNSQELFLLLQRTQVHSLAPILGRSQQSVALVQ